MSVGMTNDYTNEKSDTEEIIEEIITLLHSFSMKFYSNRRRIRKVLEKEFRDHQNQRS